MYITWQHPSARRNTFASLGQASTASHGSDWSNFSDPSKKQLHVWLCPCPDPVSGPGRAGSWATRHVVNGIFQLTCEKCSKERLSHDSTQVPEGTLLQVWGKQVRQAMVQIGRISATHPRNNFTCGFALAQTIVSQSSIVWHVAEGRRTGNIAV